MKSSELINELAKALAAAQADINDPKKNATNPHFKSQYSDLSEVLGVVRPSFSKHGLSVTQQPYQQDGNIGVRTVVLHESGQWIESELDIPLTVNRNINHDTGTTITYLRRYSLAAIAGVHQSDDDGNIEETESSGEIVSLAPESKENETISEEQVKELDALMTDAEIDNVAFFNWLKVDDLSKLKPKSFNKVKEKLEEKVAEKEVSNAS